MVTLAEPCVHGMSAGPNAPILAEASLLGAVMVKDAAPAARALNVKRATLMLPVGGVPLTALARRTFPLAFALAGDVKAGVPVKPLVDPPVALTNSTLVGSNATPRPNAESAAAVVPLGPCPVTPVRFTFTETSKLLPRAAVEGEEEPLRLALPVNGAPCA